MAKQNIKDPGAHHNSSGALIRRFLPYLAKHKAVLFLDLFCAALTTLCDIFLPKIMSTITNSAMGVGITLTTGIPARRGSAAERIDAGEPVLPARRRHPRRGRFHRQRKLAVELFRQASGQQLCPLPGGEPGVFWHRG